jgi:hypothetical protein
MPISELPAFDPIPDPPEGWTWADKSKQKLKPYKFYHSTNKTWVDGLEIDEEWKKDYIYIVPIDPPAKPEPTYRPFANAAEFLPHSCRPLRYINNKKNHYIRVDIFNDESWSLSGNYNQPNSYATMLDEYVFGDDGSPCGIKID